MLDLIPTLQDINKDTTLRQGISILSRRLVSEDRMEDYTYSVQPRNENGTKNLVTKLSSTRSELGTSNMNPSDVDGNPHNNPELPWGDLKTKAGKDRKRLPLACIACRRKKIRCSGEKPACKHCIKARTPCVYKHAARKFTPRVDYMLTLDKRMKRMEERVLKYVSKDQASALGPIARSVVRPAQVATDSAKSNRKRSVDRAFKEDRGTLALTRSDFIAAAPKKKIHTDNPDVLEEGKDKLPDEDIQEHLAEVFFEYCYGQTYLLLHKPSFMRRLKAGSIPPVLVLAVCALAARFSDHVAVRHDPPFLAGEEWGVEAGRIVLRNFDKANLTNLTVLLLLGVHEFGTCNGGRSWALGGMAMRMALALGLHKEPDSAPKGPPGPGGPPAPDTPPLTFTDREIRRRLMWSCFLMDRFNSSGTNRPQFLLEDDIQVQLPIREKMFINERAGITENLKGQVASSPPEDEKKLAKENMGVAAYNIRIVSLYGKVIKYINLGGKEEDPEPLHSPKSKFATLNAQIQAFFKNIPEDLQYNDDNLSTHATDKCEGQFLFLHLCAHAICVILHRFSVPTRPGGKPTDNCPMDFLRLSVQASFKAADTIANILSQATDRGYKVATPFLGYTAFTAATVHVVGSFSKNNQIVNSSKRNLEVCARYLTKMARFYGPLWPLFDALREQYEQHSRASKLHGKIIDVDALSQSDTSSIPQYGDWFQRFPRGVDPKISTDGENPIDVKALPSPNENEIDDPVMRKGANYKTPVEFLKGLQDAKRISPPDPTKPLPRLSSSMGKQSQGRRTSRMSIVSQPVQHQTSHMRTGCLSEDSGSDKQGPAASPPATKPTTQTNNMQSSEDYYKARLLLHNSSHMPVSPQPFPSVQTIHSNPLPPLSSHPSFDEYSNYLPNTVISVDHFNFSPPLQRSQIPSPEAFYQNHHNAINWNYDNAFPTSFPSNFPGEDSNMVGGHVEPWWMPFNFIPPAGEMAELNQGTMQQMFSTGATSNSTDPKTHS